MRIAELSPIRWPLAILVSLVSFSVTPQSQLKDAAELEKSMLQCRNEQSPLLRLACYDNLFKTQGSAAPQTAESEHSDTVKKALALEKQREPHSTGFLVSSTEGVLSPEVIITTPALGIRPPRPVLIFSCKDNITRMQIAFFTPMSNKQESDILLKTNTGVSFRSHWFIRDNGLLLESSRGLPGISEISRLMNAETLLIESENPALNGLSFPISGLSKEIATLRQACRW
ncbi:MAG: type VI secretion system-associated protein TagO [Enterobacteriaceae bacterium]|jgi:type VI secretion system protein VasI|nr:type VI secretion system-associated protein TagO [Enterobacteriaceae bacterium]